MPSPILILSPLSFFPHSSVHQFSRQGYEESTCLFSFRSAANPGHFLFLPFSHQLEQECCFLCRRPRFCRQTGAHRVAAMRGFTWTVAGSCCLSIQWAPGRQAYRASASRHPSRADLSQEGVREILLTQDTRACLVASSFGRKRVRAPFLEQVLDAGAEKGHLSSIWPRISQ